MFLVGKNHFSTNVSIKSEQKKKKIEDQIIQEKYYHVFNM